MNGRNSSVLSRPTWNAFALRITMAVSGSARSVTCVPSWLMVSPVHSLMKSRCRQRLRGRSVPAGVLTASLMNRSLRGRPAASSTLRG